MPEARRRTKTTMLAYGIGDAAGAIKSITWGVLLLFYYQQVVGLEAALVGLAIAVSVMMDAITDPLIGAWSDRIRSRWGRRHPMLAISALPLAISFVLLFSPPEGMSVSLNFLWLMTFAILVRATFTFYYIPHLALGAEMAHEYYQRSTLFAYSGLVGGLTVAVVYGLINLYYFPTVEGLYDPGYLNPDPYSTMSTTFAVVMVVAIMLCVVGTRNEIPYLRDSQDRPPLRFTTFFVEIWAVLQNSSFRAVFFGLLLGSLVGGVEGAFMPFMGIHFWGFRTEQLAYLAIVGLVAFPMVFLLIPIITKILDKRLSIMLPLACWITAVNIPICLRLLDVSWFPDNDSDWILPIYIGSSIIGALAAPIIGATANSMLADIADEHELDTGIRREGVLYSVRAFTAKITAAFGTLFGGILLSVIEFPDHAVRDSVAAETVWNLGLIAGPATSVFSLLALGFYLGYRINHARHQEIVLGLEQRREQSIQVSY